MQTQSKIASLALALFLMLLAWPLLVEAQQGKLPRIGVMFSGQKNWIDAFRFRLRDLGYIEGKNILIESRNPQGRDDKYPEIVAELIALKVDVIVVGGLSGARAAQKSNETIPIVMASGSDPVDAGLAVSLARPGGNVTGLTIMGVELTGKRLELLKEILPKATRIAVLWNPASKASIAALKEASAAAQALKLTLLSLEVKQSDDLQAGPSTYTELAPMRSLSFKTLS